MQPETINRICLSISNIYSVDQVLNLIVEGLSDIEHVALARIWLMAPGDICHTCTMRTECPDQTQCLHLVASDGVPLQPGKERHRTLNGAYRRFPLGIRKVGRMGASGEPLSLCGLEQSPDWLRDPEWARQEQLKCFAGQPLIFKGETLGVLAFFSREKMCDSTLELLQLLAARAASAIVTARAFEEIEHLREQLALENEYLREEIREVHAHGSIVGQSSALNKLLQQIDLVAPTDSTVLIEGESGTGKELIAHAIHERSARKDHPLIKVNCASIPSELFESEFFGHVKGAFTSAIKDRIGRFQLADGGTLFLDEVSEIPVELQSKLLRVLQEGEFERVGEEKTQKVDVRIISATNRNLNQEVEAKRFRQDLYFRLSVFPMEVPPLRKRPEDIPLLTEHFLDVKSRQMGIAKPKLKQRHVLELQAYPWPGNIRELQNVIERAIITAGAGGLTFDLPGESLEAPAAQRGGTDQSDALLTYDNLKRLEKQNLQRALSQTEGRIGGPDGAAELLGIKPTTLASKIKSLGIKKQ